MDREVSKKQQTRHIYDVTVMRFSVRPSPKPAVDLPTKISFQSMLAGIPRTNEPS